MRSEDDITRSRGDKQFAKELSQMLLKAAELGIRDQVVQDISHALELELVQRRGLLS